MPFKKPMITVKIKWYPKAFCIKDSKLFLPERRSGKSVKGLKLPLGKNELHEVKKALPSRLYKEVKRN